MRPRDHGRRIEPAGRLFETARGQAQPHRGSIWLLHVVEGMAQQDREFIRVRRFETREPVGRHADQRRVHRLVLPALGRQGQAGGRAHQQEARILVAGIDQRIEAAVDEGVVDRADGQQARAIEPVRQPEAGQHQEQVLLGDAEFHVLPVRGHAPALRGGELRIPEHVVLLVPVEDAAPVHPGAEIGADRDIGAGGDDPLRELRIFALPATDLGQDLAEGLLGGKLAPLPRPRRGEGGGHMDGGRGQAPPGGGERSGEGHGGEEGAQFLLRDAQPLEQVPFMARADAHGGAEGLHLLLRHQPGMVVLVAGEGQAHALDRVGDEAGRLVAFGVLGAEGLDQRLDVVAAEIHHQRRQLIIGQGVDDGADARDAAKVGQQGLAPGGAALEGQGGVEAVRAVVDPAAQRLPVRAREGGFQPAAVFQRDDVPAHVAEQALDPAEEPVGHHGIERLAVVVHHPPDIADVVLPAFQQGFVDVALIEFGIAHHRHVTPGGQALGGEVVQAHIVLHERAERRQGHAQADRACRKIHLRPVLHARGIGLDAAEVAQRGEAFAILPPEQVVDRVEDRPGMGLHRHAVRRAQDAEIQRRQDRDRGGAGGLVPAHLQPVPVRADVVGMVDHPGREPEQLALQGMEDLDTARRIGRVLPAAAALGCHSSLPVDPFMRTMAGRGGAEKAARKGSAARSPGTGPTRGGAWPPPHALARRRIAEPAARRPSPT